MFSTGTSATRTVLTAGHKMLGKNMGNRAFFIAQLKCIKSFEPEEVLSKDTTIYPLFLLFVISRPESSKPSLLIKPRTDLVFIVLDYFTQFLPPSSLFRVSNARTAATMLTKSALSECHGTAREKSPR